MSFDIPKILQDLDKIKKKLIDTDRPDHFDEVKENEKLATEALLKLSAKKNEGIKMLIQMAKDEIKSINIAILDRPVVTRKKGTTISPENYAFETQCLLNMRDCWVKFLSFFVDAEENLKAVEDFVEEQLNPEIEEDMQ